jgi:hypothetical protein
MAEDLIELGIEGIDKLVDKHFHKVPDKYIDPHTYNPRRWHRHGMARRAMRVRMNREVIMRI